MKRNEAVKTNAQRIVEKIAGIVVPSGKLERASGRSQGSWTKLTAKQHGAANGPLHKFSEY